VTAGQTPSDRIVAEIRRRITAGELGAGDRVPSARQITQEWGVAIATATKVLARLRQDGLVRVVPGVGTVVTAAEPQTPGPARTARRRAQPADEPTAGATTAAVRDRIARAAVRIADAEGMAGLSMRRVATELDLATMSLYRYVHSKDELVLLMVDMVFTEDRLPDPPPPGWRAQLETLARLQWNVGRRHPWVARVLSFTRPQLAPNAMAHTEWALRAVDGLGLDPATMLYLVLVLTSFVVGTSVSVESEAEARQESGVTSAEWMAEQDPAFAGIVASGRFPQLGRVAAIPDFDLELDKLFEFGLQRALDGLAAFIDQPSPRSVLDQPSPD
jgi:AcrR family transcriptional regulator